jgi:hypothetical protein
MKAQFDEAIADTLLWFNKLDTAMLDLFHEVAGVDPNIADAIIGDTSRVDVMQAITRLTDLSDLSEDIKQLRRDIFKEIVDARGYRNVIAHQHWAWWPPNRIIFYNSHAKDKNLIETEWTIEELQAIKERTIILTQLVQVFLRVVLTKRWVPYPDDAMLESWRQKPTLPESPHQRRKRIQEERRRQQSSAE